MRVRVHQAGTVKRPVDIPTTGGMPSLTVEEFESARFSEWNALVSRFSIAGSFHGSAWMEMLRASYGFRPLGLAIRRGSALVALIPIAEVRTQFTAPRGVSLPFADECPPLVVRGGEIPNLLHPLVAFSQSQGWRYIEIRGSNEGLRPDTPSVRFYGHRVHLAGDPNDLWARLKGTVRTSVRKAEASGVKVEVSTSLNSLRDFYQLYRLTRRRHGLPPQPFSFFEAIHDRILARDNGRVVLARLDGRCLAGAVFFQQGNRALFKFGAYDARLQNLRANNMVFWEALKRYMEEGCRVVELGRTSLGNEGLRRFKQSWASEEYAIEYAKYDLRRNGFVREPDLAAGWYNWIFRLAPCWLSVIAGKVLYKHWA